MGGQESCDLAAAMIQVRWYADVERGNGSRKGKDRDNLETLDHDE